MDFYLQQALQAVQRETSGMTPRELAWHEEGKWSAAEVLEHLSLTFSSTSKLMDKLAAEAKADVRTPTLKQRVIRRVVVNWGYFPSGRQAPDFTRPQGLPAEQAVATLCQNLVEMDGKIAICEDRFGPGWLGSHPILGPFTPRHWRKFHFIHTRHHMKQVARLRELQRQSGA